eukprot:GAFH01005335.1.p3 GENE.GAFH01005335.1~~GAFH01005335.1.p3  ORF type:complete len:95 (+),score=8.36 GAFH01005335.1:247-531(+)
MKASFHSVRVIFTFALRTKARNEFLRVDFSTPIFVDFIDDLFQLSLALGNLQALHHRFEFVSGNSSSTIGVHNSEEFQKFAVCQIAIQIIFISF